MSEFVEITPHTLKQMDSYREYEFLLNNGRREVCKPHCIDFDIVRSYREIEEAFMKEDSSEHRPADFMGRPLFETQSFEELFTLYADYQREKQDAEDMMQKVLEEIEYRTPDGWHVGRCDVQASSKYVEEPTAVEEDDEAIVNDWWNWNQDDILRCVGSNVDYFTNGNTYKVVRIDYEDDEQPVHLYDDVESLVWPSLGTTANFIKIDEEYL